MKKKILVGIGVVEVIAGTVMTSAAKTAMSDHSYYTWRSPYTSYEKMVIMTKWIGLLLLVFAVMNFVACIYANKHIKDVDDLSPKGGMIKCSGCGLQISAKTEVCPRCGMTAGKNMQSSNGDSSGANYCAKCGNKINQGVLFCPKCGNKIE
jgi:ribosomal protein L32